MCSLQAFSIENVTIMALITADMRRQSVQGTHQQTILTALITKKNVPFIIYVIKGKGTDVI